MKKMVSEEKYLESSENILGNLREYDWDSQYLQLKICVHRAHVCLIHKYRPLSQDHPNLTRGCTQHLMLVR